MCGRARCTLQVDDVGRACGLKSPLPAVDSERFHPSYNVSPGRYMPVVRRAGGGNSAAAEDSKELVVHCMKWGLIPSFCRPNDKPDHFRMFNARSESVHEKASFRALLPKKRCVAVVEGFYEWKRNGNKKQPYYIHFKDERPVVFACLYDSWKDLEGNVLYTFTIVTTRASKLLSVLHERMPVILPNEEAINLWLNGDNLGPYLHKLTQPYETPDLIWYPVTQEVGKPSFDSPKCVEEIKSKVANESKIAQLFGKRVHLETSSNEWEEMSEVVCDNEPQVAARGLMTTMPANSDVLTAEDEKALVAAMEPDQDLTQGPSEEKDMEEVTGPEFFKTKVNTENWKPAGISKQAHGYTLGQGVKYLSGAKRKSSPATPKSVNKKVDSRSAKDKQSSLLLFFGKG